ncbi:LXG domain-containing protein [Alkalihalobacillus macyae]|uniref:LXG domain-containing protein n=1 Tax=Guptibacillus hwajinpoensis TaxID=208199 RepID=UPI00273AD7B9|nr:LXG domain-containing protein [Alkalihalobacillus macyae]MDP4552891.1 LXG domain-containing protein [Alkalihalobacillus macyae]
MKVLDAQSFHTDLNQLEKSLISQTDQIQNLMDSIKEFATLDEVFSGKGGESIRSFYEDFHFLLLESFSYALENYANVLSQIKDAEKTLEPSEEGFIRQDYIENDLTNGLNKANNNTSQLVSETNAIIGSVSDIIYAPKLDDDRFHSTHQKALKESDQTVDDLLKFDQMQMRALDNVENDLHIIKAFIDEVRAKFDEGSISLNKYNDNELKNLTSYTKVNSNVSQNKVRSYGNRFTSPLDFINKQMSWGDNVLVGYQTASSVSTLLVSRKLKIHYFNSKPTIWNRIKGDYEFSVKTDPSWTSRGGHSSPLAKKILDFSRGPSPTNPLMKSMYKFVSSYESPSHLYKHVAGFPKNINRLSGAGLLKGTVDRVKTGTKEVLQNTAKIKGFTKLAKGIPLVATGVSFVSNMGELTADENADNSLAENTGRAIFGFGTDIVAIGAGAQIGATIGSVGGPIGIVVGGAVGGLMGGIASSKFGDKVKDVGGTLFRNIENGFNDSFQKTIDFSEDAKKAINSWFN